MSSLYADLVQQPVDAVRRIYEKGGLEFTASTEARIRDYLAAKPQGKFGRHAYSLSEETEAARRRGLFQRYQDYFGVPKEV